jgi:hypothetical protein
MKTKVMTKSVAMGLCMFCGLNLWAAGEPAFETSTPFADAGYPRGSGGTAWGDYNKDGNPDAFIFGYGTFKLYQGHGNSTFTDVTDAVFGQGHPASVWVGSAAWLDYNNDDNLDLVVAGNLDGSDTTIVYVNAGEADSYALTADVSVTLPAMQSGNEKATGRFIAVADYDGDGYDDILIAPQSHSSTTFSLYKNNGAAGGFTLQTEACAGGGFPDIDRASVAWGDFNGDTKPDILFSGHLKDRGDKPSDDIAGVYENNGDGTFKSLIAFTKGAYDGEVAWIDYNKDGKLDALITGTYWEGENYWWNTFLYGNNGDGTFTQVADHGIGGTCESYVAVGDINKDEYDDVVIMGQNTNGVFYNNGDGTFTKTQTLIIPSFDKGMISVVDIDNDGDLDFVTTGNYIEPTLYQNKYPEGAGVVEIPPLPEPADVALVEFTEEATPVGGTAAFPVNLTRGGAAWGDYDDDGNLDVLIWGYYDSESATLTKLYKNNGNGTFTDKSNDILGSTFPKIAKGAAAWLDYNNDGYLDLIVSGATTVNDDPLQQATITEIYTNEGPIVGYILNKTPATSGIFPSFDYEKNGGIARNIAIADYDNDGWQDILFCARYADVDAGETERRFEIYKNKAGKTFELQPNASTGLVAGNGGGVAWGDYNNDGYQDILFSGYRDNVEGGYRSGVFTNKGNGTFTETLFYVDGADYGYPEDGQKLFGTETGEVTWVDVNADGYLDAIITGSGNTYGFSGELHVYNAVSWQWWVTTVFLYDPEEKAFGSGIPNEMNTRIGGTCESGITWADLNDDGLPDVVTSGQHEGSSINYNTSNGTFNRQALGKNLQQGTVTLVDFNKDGKLDIFATGTEGVLLFKNTSSITPVAPDVPTGFTATPGADGELTLAWTASSDPTVRYNIFAKKPLTDYTNLIISLAPVDETTGALKVSYDHLPLLSTNRYALKGIDGGEYTVGVQAVSINGETSAFATSTVTVAGGGSSTGVEKAIPGSFSAYRSGDNIVATTDVTQEAELAVYGVSGAKVWSKTGILAGSVQITGLPKGAVYFVALRVGNATEVRKVAL